jgi:hypothetical protein
MSIEENRTEPLDAIIVRLNSLEKENIRLKRVQRLIGVFALAVGVIVVLAAGSFSGAVAAPRATPAADSIDLRDAKNNVRYSVRLNQNDDAYIRFYDAGGRIRIVLGIEVNGNAHLSIFDGAGNARHRFVAPP